MKDIELIAEQIEAEAAERDFINQQENTQPYPMPLPSEMTLPWNIESSDPF